MTAALEARCFAAARGSESFDAEIARAWASCRRDPRLAAQIVTEPLLLSRFEVRGRGPEAAVGRLPGATTEIAPERTKMSSCTEARPQ